MRRSRRGDDDRVITRPEERVHPEKHSFLGTRKHQDRFRRDRLIERRDFGPNLGKTSRLGVRRSQ